MSTNGKRLFSALGLLAACDGAAPAMAPVDATTATDAARSDIAPDLSTDAVTATDAPCTRGSSYPAGPYGYALGSTLPDTRFAGANGSAITTRDLWDPCGTGPSLLVVRTMVAWSGPSRYYAAHTGALHDNRFPPRIAVIDLLALGQANLPATLADLDAWRAQYDMMPGALAIDPDYGFRALAISNPLPPVIALIDTHTMRIVGTEPSPLSDQLDYSIAFALARIDHVDPPRGAPPAIVDDRFTPSQWAMVQAMTPVPAVPADPTNAHADDAAAAALGRDLFGDMHLSPTGTVACATCHVPGRAFSDGRATGMGVAAGGRNTPTVLFSAFQRWQFWDGRADTQWSQALGPVENPVEMNGSRLLVAHRLAAEYAARYEAVFGPLPPLSDAARFPASGRPGDPAWDAMAPADQQAVNRVFANAGKAISAYERTLRTRPAPLDAYAAGNFGAMTVRARDGLFRWFEAGCIQCHYGPLLTDDSFHDIWMPSGHADASPDRGRIDAIAQLLANPFRATGPFSDAPDAGAHLAGLAVADAMLGQFHTPSLRGAGATGPWGHGGTFDTLERVVLHYARIGMDAIPTTAGTRDVHLGNFHQDDVYVGSLADVIRAATANPLMP